MTRAEERALEAYPGNAEEYYEIAIARNFFKKGYEQAEKDIMEQMMRDAVEVRVQRSPLNGPLGISAYCCNFPSEHPFYHCKEGDKVKVIIVKEN